MSDPLRYIIPIPPPESELFANYRVTHAFYDEVKYREALQEYCNWYQQVSAQNRRELGQMRGDVNIFGWFCRRR